MYKKRNCISHFLEIQFSYLLDQILINFSLGYPSVLRHLLHGILPGKPLFFVDFHMFLDGDLLPGSYSFFLELLAALALDHKDTFP